MWFHLIASTFLMLRIKFFRKERTPDHPWTPDKYTICSTRSWQGVMRIWRRKLHYWDPSSYKEDRENFLNVSAKYEKNFTHSI